MTYKNEVFIGMPKTKPKAPQEAMIEDAPWYTVILGDFGCFWAISKAIMGEQDSTKG